MGRDGPGTRVAGTVAGLYPERPRAIDIDRERGIRNFYPGGGGLVGLTYNVAYTKAMLQGALSF